MASLLHAITFSLFFLGLVQARKLQDSVFGTVFCDSCLEGRLTHNSIVFSDAKLLVKCGKFETPASTNKTGQFEVQIPSELPTSLCSVELLSKPLHACNASKEKKATMDLMYSPDTPLIFCRAREELTLGPPDPPQPSNVKHLNSYHLGPPDPPRPKVGTKTYHLMPPNPPQPRVHN